MRPQYEDPDKPPILVSFRDGSPDSYGIVPYNLWTLVDGTKVTNLLIPKPKLGQLLQKGEIVRNKLSGASVASRLKNFIFKNSGMNFDGHIPFLDSQIVQAMTKKESYGFNSFAGLRVG